MISSDTFSLTDEEQSRFANVQRLGEGGTKNIPQLLEMLIDPSWILRRSVVETLAYLGDSAVDAMVELLSDKRDNEARIAAVVDALSASSGNVEQRIFKLADHHDPAVQADVAQILGRRRSPLSVPTLVNLTANVDDNVAVGAIEALGRIGGRAAVEALLEIVGSKNFFRVFPAIDVLGRSGDPRAVEPLTKLLLDPTYLPEASRALGRSGEKSAIGPLVGLFRATGDTIVRVAATSLWELRDRYQEKSGGNVDDIEGAIRAQIKIEMVRRLLRVLPQSDNLEAIAICELLGVIGDPEAAPALTLALDREGPIAKCAATSLKKIGRDADASLLRAISTGSTERRKVLLPLVTRSSGALEVANCLSDPDPNIRALACDTLARLGNPGVVKLIFPLLEDRNLRVVHSATAALQALGSRETRTLAVQATQSTNPVVRRSSLRILAYFGDSSALEPILKGLSDPDLRVREAALQGLPYLDGDVARKALFKSAQSADSKTRSLAMRALGQLPNSDEAVNTLLLKGLVDTDPWTRYYACQSLGRLGYVPASSDVAKLLDDNAGQVRVAAVEALSHFDSPGARAALRKGAEREDLEVRRTALVGLGIAGRDEDLPVLLSALTSADAATRLIALSSIAKFSSGSVLPSLSTAASDRDDQVSASAISFLGARREQEATTILVKLLATPALSEKAKSALLVPSEGRGAGLLIALESADHELAAVLISILSRLQRPETRNALISAMRLNNVAARKAAAPALAARRDFEMIAVVQEAAENDPDQEVRQICSLLLRQ